MSSFIPSFPSSFCLLSFFLLFVSPLLVSPLSPCFLSTRGSCVRLSGGVPGIVADYRLIRVVEIMAAGAIALAHNSGGPRADIVVDHGGCTGTDCDRCAIAPLLTYSQCVRFSGKFG